MRELTTEAIILDNEPAGEQDALVSLYTKEWGRISARAKSLRAIDSKLAAHLQPLSHSTIRLVKKQGIQVVDALRRTTRLSIDFAHMCAIVRALAAPEHPDAHIWYELTAENGSPTKLLTALGFDPRHATCQKCHKAPQYFSLADSAYYCESCRGLLRIDASVYRLARNS